MKIARNHLGNFVNYAVISGVPANILREQLSPYVRTEDKAAKISAKAFIGSMEIIAGLLNDDLLGLRTGRHLEMNTLGIIYQVSLKAATVEEGLYYCHDYIKKTIPQIEVSTFHTRDKIRIQVSADTFPEQIARILLETTLTVMGKEITMMYGSPEIMYTSPFCNEQYPADWRKRKEFSISFSKKVLKAGLKNFLDQGIDILVPQYLKMLEHLKDEDTFTSRVKMAVLNLATPSLPSIESVAEVYNYTIRSFQRKLAAEGVIFRDLIDEIKKEMSMLLIRHKRLQVADIAVILGYSESSSLIRSFRKWYGKSPEQYRRSSVIDE